MLAPAAVATEMFEIEVPVSEAAVVAAVKPPFATAAPPRVMPFDDCELRATVLAVVAFVRPLEAAVAPAIVMLRPSAAVRRTWSLPPPKTVAVRLRKPERS